MLYQLLLSQMVDRLVERMYHPVVSSLILTLINLHNSLDILDNLDR
jgi:hypothetical protein